MKKTKRTSALEKQAVVEQIYGGIAEIQILLDCSRSKANYILSDIRKEYKDELDKGKSYLDHQVYMRHIIDFLGIDTKHLAKSAKEYMLREIAVNETKEKITSKLVKEMLSKRIDAIINKVIIEDETALKDQD